MESVSELRRWPAGRLQMSFGWMADRNMSTGLLRVAERAIRDPDSRFDSLAHHLDENALKRAFHRIRKDGAEGVDGVTKEAYGQDLDGNIRNLHGRLKSMKYRHQPIRRVHIPKAPGKTRPIGISCLEDKVVQGALKELLEVIYEQEFLPCSYGFRPELGAHDALRAVNRMVFREGIGWILEADIQAFFDSLVRPKLREMLQDRIADGSLLRLVGKCLHVGVLDGEEFVRPDEGTVQGSVLTPPTQLKTSPGAAGFCDQSFGVARETGEEKFNDFSAERSGRSSFLDICSVSAHAQLDHAADIADSRCVRAEPAWHRAGARRIRVARARQSAIDSARGCPGRSHR